MPIENVIRGLNNLLADYMVFYQRLRNYHWNVRGRDFFQLHDAFEEAYLETRDHVDAIAERILALGGTPHSTLRAYVENARLSEQDDIPDSGQMVRQLLSDIRTLKSHTIQAVELAEDTKDRTTVNLLDDMIDRHSKREWMFERFLNE